MKASVRVGTTLWAAIISIIPAHNIDLISEEKLKPKSIMFMGLVLVDFGVGVENNNSRIVLIVHDALNDCFTLWVLLRFGNLLLLDVVANTILQDILSQFIRRLDFLFIERKKHGIKMSAIFGLNNKTTTIVGLAKHLLHLIVYVK